MDQYYSTIKTYYCYHLVIIQNRHILTFFQILNALMKTFLVVLYLIAGDIVF